MENPVDHTLDLGFVNYVQHPENPNYIVFRFHDPNRAHSFESALNENQIWFEKGEEEKRGTMVQLFGIHKNDFKKVEKINYQVEGKHKKPLIPWKGLRYFLLLFSLTVLTLAIIGYCKQQEKLRSFEETNQSLNDPN
jgi:hypothetical protein